MAPGATLLVALAACLGSADAASLTPADPVPSLSMAPARGAPSAAATVPPQARLRVAVVATARILRASAAPNRPGDLTFFLTSIILSPPIFQASRSR